MRVLFLGINQTGVGTFWRMFQFAKQMVRQGHSVTIVSMSPSRRRGIRTYDWDGVEIVETPDLLWGPFRSGWDIWNIFNRVWWMAGKEFDLVHAFETRPTVLIPALFAKHIQKKPLFLDWGDWFGRGGAVEERTNRLHKFILRRVDTYFENRFRRIGLGTSVICNKLKLKAMELGVPEEELLLISDGCNVIDLLPLEKAASRAVTQLPHQVPIIGYVGAIYHRDAELMAQAFDLVQAVLPDAKLLLIGYVNRPIVEMVADRSAVILTGRIEYEALNSFIAACDLCWLPYVDSGTNQGRWPMKLNDYMSVGKATVATAVGDVPIVIEQHQVGVTTRPTAADIAQKTVDLLNDSDQLARMLVQRPKRHMTGRL